MFEYTLVGGLVASGADAYLLHVTTTPSVAYVARVDEFDCGIMISASHNPYFDNGIKLINGNGEKMDEETISLTSLKIMEVMMARKKKLSELSEGFTVYPQVLTNVRVTDKKAAQDDADVQAAVKKVTEELGDTGRILVRESGTEPVVRVMVEAESEEICQKYVDMVVNVIKENGYVAG